MNITTHLGIALIASLLFYPLVGPVSFWMLVGGFLIDFDHYLFAILRFKSFSLSKAYWWHRWHGTTPDYERDILHIAHTVESFALIAIIGIFWEPAFWVLQGMILHVLMDLINLFRHNLVDTRAISLLGWLKRRNFL